MWGVYHARAAAYLQYVSLYMRVGEGDNVACYAWGAGKRDDLVPALPTRQDRFFLVLRYLGRSLRDARHREELHAVEGRAPARRRGLRRFPQ